METNIQIVPSFQFDFKPQREKELCKIIIFLILIGFLTLIRESCKKNPKRGTVTKSVLREKKSGAQH